MQQTKGEIQSFQCRSINDLQLFMVNFREKVLIIDAACINKLNNAKLKTERLEEILRGFIQ